MSETEIELPPPSGPRDKASAEPWRRYGVAEIFADPEPISWVSEDLELAPGAPTLIAGYGFSGKTVMIQALALAVASGGLAFDALECSAGRVLHLDYEQGSRLTSERYRRLAIGHGVSEVALADRLGVVAMPPLYLDSRDAEDVLARETEGNALVIVDSLRAACPTIDENSSEARRPLDMMGRVSERTGAAFVVVHHARKPSKDAPGGARMAIRGSGALYDACQSVLVMTADKGAPPRVHHEKARLTGRLREDFDLRIEDVGEPRDPRAGLRVTCVRSSIADGVRIAASNAEIEREVLAAIDGSPGLSGREVCSRVRGKRERTLAALDALEREGKIERRRSGRADRWFLA